jgi:alpha-beta hydrolase superfamily lysophospholipase
MFLPEVLTRARWPAAALGAVALIANMRWLDTLERKLIFAPPQSSQLDSTLHMGFAEHVGHEVWIPFVSTCTGLPVQLHGQWHPHVNAQAPALLLLHGSRADVKRSADRIHQLGELGFSVLAIDYRGFGKSGRELPSEATACEDARAAWHWLAEQQPHHARYVFGHSLGGAIAIDLASSIADASGLIVDSSFTSMNDVVKHFSWSSPQVLRRITQQFDAARKITRVRAPVLVVHGERDEFVPVTLGRALWENATSRKRFVLVQGGSHYNTLDVGRALYAKALRELFGLSA